MTEYTKRTFLLFLIGASVALFLLATSLSNLQLNPGTPFPGGGSSGEIARNANASLPVPTSSIPVLQGIFALVLLTLMIYVPFKMVALVDRKSILRLALAIVILLVIVLLLPRLTPEQPGFSSGETSNLAPPPTFDYPVTPLGEPPDTLVWLVVVGVGLGISLVLIKYVGRWRSPNMVGAEVLQEAEQAVSALEAGWDLRNVIMRCYLQMARILQEKQGIERSDAMTVHEFEGRLEALGFPEDPVHQITSLFEKVRYGVQPTSEQDEARALESLKEIIQFCRQGSE